MTRPACALINTEAARHNLEQVRSLTKGRKVMAIIKADAYGHGLVRMAQALRSADAFGVACLEEAVTLHDSGIGHPIVLLEGPFSPEEMQLAAEFHFEIVVHHREQMKMLAEIKPPVQLNVWLKIDTGMHRLGFAPGEAAAVWKRLRESDAVTSKIRLMTHLANAQQRDDASVREQLRCFAEVTASIAAPRSIANSAGILAWPETYGDWVRPGLMLYGVSPLNGEQGHDHELRPVMTFQSNLIAIKEVEAGGSVGYGATWRCPERMRVGIVAVGYGDGYPRNARNGTPVLVNTKRAAVIGKVSMDMLTVDLRNVPEAQVGDPVVLWGVGLPVEEIAAGAGTVAYELICSVGKRVHFKTVAGGGA